MQANGDGDVEQKEQERSEEKRGEKRRRKRGRKWPTSDAHDTKKEGTPLVNRFNRRKGLQGVWMQAPDAGWLVLVVDRDEGWSRKGKGGGCVVCVLVIV